MRRAAYLVFSLSLLAATAASFADEVKQKVPSAVEEARKAFQGAASKIYAELISELSAEHKKEIATALGCDDGTCAEKAAEFLINCCPAFTLSDDEASAVVSGKFNDEANETLVSSCAKCLESLGTPLPLLFTHLIEKVRSKKIQGGIELEFTARFLAFHASKAAKLLAEKTSAK